jgi:hypothetical protein
MKSRSSSRPNTSHTWSSAKKTDDSNADLDSTTQFNPRLSNMKNRNMGLDAIRVGNPLLVKKIQTSPANSKSNLKISVPGEASSTSSSPRLILSTSSMLRNPSMGEVIRRGKSAGHMRKSSLISLIPGTKMQQSSFLSQSYSSSATTPLWSPAKSKTSTPSNRFATAWNAEAMSRAQSPQIDTRHLAILELTQLSIKDREQHLIDEMQQEQFLRSDPLLSKTKQKLDDLLTYKPFEKEVTAFKKIVQLPHLGILLDVDRKDKLYRYYVPDEQDLCAMSQVQLNKLETMEEQEVDIDDNISTLRSARALSEEVNLNTAESEVPMEDEVLTEQLRQAREPFLHFLYNAKRRQKRRKEIVDAQIQRTNLLIDQRKKEDLEKMYMNMNDEVLGRREMTFQDTPSGPVVVGNAD